MIDPLNNQQSALRDLYVNLMMELRQRIDVVGGVLNGSYKLPDLAAYELCHLQFRLVCELIALASLAAHGDIPATRSGRLLKAYQADAILNALEKLHQNFYPQPSRQVIGSDGKVKSTVLIKSGFLTKAELLTLYHECGDLLHRGTMRAVKPRTAGDFAKIQNTMKKIVTLLNHHEIELIDPDWRLLVLMNASGKVQAVLARKIAPARLH